MALTNSPTGLTTQLGGADGKVDINSIDFVNQFEQSINRLREALGVTRMQPLTRGNIINIWKSTVTTPAGTKGTDDGADGIVNPGVDIPLTSVSREKTTKEVEWHKYRKVVPAETIQRFGYDLAVAQTDQDALMKLHRMIRDDFFTELADDAGTTSNVTGGLQEAAGESWSVVMDKFDGDVDQIVMFVNPVDAGKYLGSAAIENGQSVGFGLTLVENFVGVRLIITNSVPAGNYYATAVNNLNFAYVPTSDPELTRALAGKQMISGELGIVSLVHDFNTTNLSQQSTIWYATKLFPEVAEGVVKGTITAPKA